MGISRFTSKEFGICCRGNYLAGNGMDGNPQKYVNVKVNMKTIRKPHEY